MFSTGQVEGSYSQGRRMTALQEDNPAIRLAFAGDPARGIPPCAACHGPGAHQLRAAIEDAAGRLYRAPAHGLRPVVSAE
jgi:hypothetical protein